MRDLVLGLEVVLADGRVWNGLRRLRKDNTGYDLKHLFIGSEGTLGIITGAVLKLFPKPVTSVTALIGLSTIHGALDLLGDIRRVCGDRVSTFEVMSESEYALVLAHKAALRDPLERRSPWYAFVELTDALAKIDLRALLTDYLAGLLQAGTIRDATIAENVAQADNIWHIRHTVTEANLASGAGVSHDTSVPVSRVPDFVEGCERELGSRFPDGKIYFVGHVGDGNIHVVVIFPRDSYPDAARFSAIAAKVNATVDEVTLSLDGSISAEHGIGLSNRQRLAETKNPLELGFMRQIKSMFDPAGLMNPGKLL
jgi:FAD/FMN-containing dehydrogenase